jgi:hypothetical protein
MFRLPWDVIIFLPNVLDQICLAYTAEKKYQYINVKDSAVGE